MHRNGRGGRGGGGGRRRGGYGHGRGRRGFNPRQAAQSGNKRERISIESGDLVLIDQFMLANPQFIEKVKEHIDSDAETKESLIHDFGGYIVHLAPGTYRIERDPFACSIVVHPEDSNVEEGELAGKAGESEGTVFVDTRCLAMVDKELLDDSELLLRYQSLWFLGEEKACRDLIRDNGGAVRYGFNRLGDELNVHVVEGDNIVCLWPQTPQSEGAEAAPAE